MISYVAGFLMDHQRDWVVLVQKKRPDWQAGLYNGVGGHVENGETNAEAMRREFYEEAGVDIDTWVSYAYVTGDWGSVEFFRAYESKDTLRQVHAKTDEAIHVLETKRMPYQMMLPNLSFLLPLALYTHDIFEPVHFKETPQRRTVEP